MNSILNKLRANTGRRESITDSSLQRSSQSTEEGVQEENVLADEQDATTGGIGGMLAISDESMKSPTDSAKDFSYEVPCDGNFSTANRVTFEVISAEVIRDGRSGHVNYTILINPHRETLKTSQTVVIRRYSDFEQLHHQLKKRFTSVMSHISFPRKVITGNFTSETIAKRSTAFEQYLVHLFSFFEVRYCSEFMEFFVKDNFQLAVESFLTRNFSRAASYFEKTLPVLEKLYGDSHPHVFHCLCGLVISYMNIEKCAVACACAEVALKCSGAADDETMASLTLTAIRLYWTLGKDKQALETRLQTMRSRGTDVNSVKDLHDILQNTFHLQRK